MPRKLYTFKAKSFEFSTSQAHEKSPGSSLLPRELIRLNRAQKGACAYMTHSRGSSEISEFKLWLPKKAWLGQLYRDNEHFTYVADTKKHSVGLVQQERVTCLIPVGT